MTSFAEWEARQRFPTVQATADALGVRRGHVHRLRKGERVPSQTLVLLMLAIERLRAQGEAWPPENRPEAP